ncbi:MAG: DUF2441 domain-containing protein [Clostridia bacterium]|nr:DUF2441 domain-containing protein [Clostridia bacterium]
MYAYHVVTERPMVLGQRIVFDEEHHSGVYQRVMDRVDIVKDVYAHPEKYPLPLEHHIDVAIRELAMEQVRKEKFPEYPSRMASLYVSATFEEAKQWADYFVSLGRPTYAIVKLRVEGRSFVGDACNCFDGTPDLADNLARAEHYWRNLPNDEGRPIHEMLVDGEIVVEEIAEEINANLP